MRSSAGARPRPRPQPRRLLLAWGGESAVCYARAASLAWSAARAAVALPSTDLKICPGLSATQATQLAIQIATPVPRAGAASGATSGQATAATGHHHHHHGGGDVMSALSQLLGERTSEIGSALQGGQSLTDLAKSKGISQDDLAKTLATALQGQPEPHERPRDGVREVARVRVFGRRSVRQRAGMAAASPLARRFPRVSAVHICYCAEPISRRGQSTQVDEPGKSAMVRRAISLSTTRSLAHPLAQARRSTLRRQGPWWRVRAPAITSLDRAPRRAVEVTDAVPRCGPSRGLGAVRRRGDGGARVRRQPERADPRPRGPYRFTLKLRVTVGAGL